MSKHSDNSVFRAVFIFGDKRVLYSFGPFYHVSPLLFASRRRHTRQASDWSSVVCSSDLSYVIDNLSSLMKILTILGGAFVLSISTRYLKICKIFLIEYPVLVLSSILGMMVMISSNDLMVFYIGLELQSLALYVLASFNRDQLKSTESGLKYFVLSALSSGLLLYGCSLIYGFSGSTNFNIIGNFMNSTHYGLTFGIVFILVGLYFKISAVPFHMWAPDVYEGSPTSVTLFFAIVPKVAALTVFISFLYVPF